MTSTTQIGVSLDFLSLLRNDPRTKLPMISLVYPDIDPTSLQATRLAKIASKLRVFSYLSRTEENALYIDESITREQWLEYVNRPPTTTTHIFICIITPDAERINGSGSYANKLLKGTSQSGIATDFVCHAHSFMFNNLVSALEIDAKTRQIAEFAIYQEEMKQLRIERELRQAALLSKSKDKPAPRKQQIERQTKALKRHPHNMRHAAHMTTSRYSAGFGKQKRRVAVPKPLVFGKGSSGKSKRNKRPATAGPKRSSMKNKSNGNNANQRPQTAQQQRQKQKKPHASFASLGEQKGQQGQQGQQGHNERPSTAPLGNRLVRTRRRKSTSKTSINGKEDSTYISWNNKPFSGTTEFLPQTASPIRLKAPKNFHVPNAVNLESLWHSIHVPNVASTTLPFDPKEAFDDDLHAAHPLTLLKEGFKIKHSDLDKVPRGRFNIMLRWANAAAWSQSPFQAIDAERRRKTRIAAIKRQEVEAKEEERRMRIEKFHDRGGVMQKKYNKIVSTLTGGSSPVDMRKRRDYAIKKLKGLGNIGIKRHGNHLDGGDFKDADEDEDQSKDHDPPFVPTPRFYWIDVFVQDPHFVDGKDEKKATEFYQKELDGIITSIGRTVLVLEPLLAPVPLRRSRCLWALYLTSLHQDVVELCVAFPKEEYYRFQRKLIKKFNKLIDIFCDLRCERSSQYCSGARRALRNILKHEGHEKVNDVCRGALTVFLLREARAALNLLVNDTKVPLLTESILLCNQFGHLLMHSSSSSSSGGDGGGGSSGGGQHKNDLKEAELLLQRGLKDAEEVNGSIVRPKDVVMIRGHLATLLKMRGKLNQSLAKLLRNLEASKRIFGDGSSEALNAANIYASLLTRMGQSKKAELLFKSSLTSAERAKHEEHGQGDDMIHMFANESCRTMMDEIGAAPLAERVKEVSNPLIGKVGIAMQRHTNQLSLLLEADADLGLRGPNGFDSSIKLYRRVLAGHRKSLGIHHPNTFLALYNLAHTLYQKSEHTGDKSHLVEAELYGRLSLEGYTQFNLVSDIKEGVQLLGNILQSLDREQEAIEMANKAGLIFFCGRLLQKES